MLAFDNLSFPETVRRLATSRWAVNSAPIATGQTTTLRTPDRCTLALCHQRARYCATEVLSSRDGCVTHRPTLVEWAQAQHSPSSKTGSATLGQSQNEPSTRTKSQAFFRQPPTNTTLPPSSGWTEHRPVPAFGIVPDDYAYDSSADSPSSWQSLPSSRLSHPTHSCTASWSPQWPQQHPSPCTSVSDETDPSLRLPKPLHRPHV